MGTARAPVVGSGRAPAWMARVRIPQSRSSGSLMPLTVQRALTSTLPDRLRERSQCADVRPEGNVADLAAATSGASRRVAICLDFVREDCALCVNRVRRGYSFRRNQGTRGDDAP